AAGNGTGRCGAAGRRAALPLRTTGCLKKSRSSTLRASSPRPLKWAVPTVYLGLLHAYIGEFRSPDSSRIALRLRFVGGVPQRPDGIFEDAKRSGWNLVNEIRRCMHAR